MKPDVACLEGPRDAARFTIAVLSARCSNVGEALAEIRLKASHISGIMIVDISFECDAEADSKDESLRAFMSPPRTIDTYND